MYISINLNDRVEYLKKLQFYQIKGTHNADIEFRSDLGILMEKLKSKDQGCAEMDYNDVRLILKNILDIIKGEIVLEKFYNQYKNYRILIKNRNNEIQKYNNKFFRKIFCFLQKEVPNLRYTNRSIWGSSRQLLFGKIVVDEINNEYKFNLHPIFGSLLSPTGGITGPGNLVFLKNIINFPIIMHTIVHNGAGYLYVCHKLGPGYNYLEEKSCLPKSSSLNFIFGGIKFWNEIVNKDYLRIS